MAAPTTWNPEDDGGGINYDRSVLTAFDSRAAPYIGLAIDLDARLLWLFCPILHRWNASATANPATGVGGMSLNLTGPVTPAWGGYKPSSEVEANFGSQPFFRAAPAGFSSWDALAGSPTAFTPLSAGDGLTLSAGNLTCTVTANGGWRSVTTNNPLATGKVYFEYGPNVVDTSQGFIAGLCVSGFSKGTYPGGDGYSVGWQAEGSLYRLSGSADTFLLSTVSRFRSVRATNPRASGKRYFEITAATITDNGFIVGFGTAQADVQNYAGATASSFGYQPSTGTIYGSAPGIQVFGTLPAGGTVGIALDLDAKKLWLLNAGHDTPGVDPAAGTGGGDVSTHLSVDGVFPMLSVYEYDARNVGIANFGATPFVGAVPAGFLAWDGIFLPPTAARVQVFVMA
ncbi:MAG TPA: SPRY domain-containing protein [Acetobacteraceae bacterium]